jgi:hypothetical protein
MRECLREIAELPPRMRIVFFREQADIVAKREQALEQGECFGIAVLQLVIVGKPESAREKHAFSGRQAVNVRLGSITEHKAVDHKLPLDCRDGAASVLGLLTLPKMNARWTERYGAHEKSDTVSAIPRYSILSLKSQGACGGEHTIG